MNDRLSSKGAPRWVRRKDARPEEITAAALDLFVERGFANTRLEDVAAKAGISKGTLYLYFANKEDLFKAAVREALVARLVEFKGQIGRFQGPTAELLRLVFKTWWERIGSTRLSGIPKLIFSEARNFPEITRFYVEEVVRPGRETLAAVIRRGIERGEFRDVDAHATADLLAAPMLMISMWRNALEPCCDERIDPEALIAAHVEMLVRGLARN
ncbi:MAG TPA: TetR/AcrR family transcriptional regulator [Burkholderiales bacterium]|jgi:AcrR family transcriptional regulator|nr:TetR/AcrR family transcriptional regulator [Burkholderiales bacterium]